MRSVLTTRCWAQGTRRPALSFTETERPADKQAWGENSGYGVYCVRLEYLLVGRAGHLWEVGLLVVVRGLGGVPCRFLTMRKCSGRKIVSRLLCDLSSLWRPLPVAASLWGQTALSDTTLAPGVQPGAPWG